ncbi:MAG: transketolase [Myxococcales bacterium]|nr:transketolase [Myxococcales bacterium]
MSATTSMQPTSLDERSVCTLRALAMDAIQQANSGHPGLPMGMADAAFVLWTEQLKMDATAPQWADRDRFVLSAGHGSMLLYGLLHLTGYDLSMDELKAFRQWGSKTPGHPEFGHTDGVECTTGPLGQGVSMAVGMALGEAKLRSEFGSDLVDHHTWVLAGDGCLMEGVSNEAASLAGLWKLGRLNVLWDDNHITIDGDTSISFSEDVCARFAALGWSILKVDGHDRAAVSAALRAARSDESQPTLIACRTQIGRCSPNLEGSNKTHGSPLGDAEVAATKVVMGLDPTQFFHVDADVYGRYRQRNGELQAQHTAWKQRVAAHPRGAALLQRLNPEIDRTVGSIAWPSQPAGAKLATRKASNKVIQAVSAAMPGLLGGSADLEGSNGTRIDSSGHLSAEDMSPANVHYGVREHAMGAIANGLAVHGGHTPFVGTFLVFHDYMRPAVRMSALMRQQVVYVYTHDSIFLGEDGPTHQPVETLQAMRGVPNLLTLRPCDLAETAASWRVALLHKEGPSALCLTRQGLPEIARDGEGMTAWEGVSRGGYILREASAPLKLVIIATGSEVQLALSARDLLEARGVGTRVVSMPCCELFDVQEREYRRKVLPAGAAKLSVEAGVTRDWARYVGMDGASVGIDAFGASAPANVLAEQFGFTPENVAARAQELLVQ